MEAVSSLASPSQKGLWAAKLKGAIEEKELKLQTLPSLASENANLRAEVTW